MPSNLSNRVLACALASSRSKPPEGQPGELAQLHGDRLYAGTADARPASDRGLTRVVGGHLVKVMSWYDNEWGYANQMLREALALANVQSMPQRTERSTHVHS